MGRTENIKRAKKLKEAKRKREKDALIIAGLGPSSIALKARNINKGIEIQLNNSTIKYSELLEEFVHPIINDYDDTSILKVKFIFAMYAWNAAIMKEKSEEAYLLAKKDVLKITNNAPEMAELFDELVRRKQEEFSEYKNIIVDFEMKKIGKFDYDLTVATTAINEL